ncbi:MAG: DinB family protein, partial [Bacteroidota bacterium]
MVQTIPSKSQATLATLIKDYAAYNQWANKAIVDWLRTKPTDVFDKIVPSSFPSLRETLVHIWDCQRFWLAVVSERPIPPSFRLEGFHGTLEEVLTGIVEQSGEFTEYVNTLNDDVLLEDCHFSTKWVEGTKARFEFIHHCLNHSTYHRGQLVTIGRNI